MTNRIVLQQFKKQFFFNLASEIDFCNFFICLGKVGALRKWMIEDTWNSLHLCHSQKKISGWKSTVNSSLLHLPVLEIRKDIWCNFVVLLASLTWERNKMVLCAVGQHLTWKLVLHNQPSMAHRTVFTNVSLAAMARRCRICLNCQQTATYNHHPLPEFSLRGHHWMRDEPE